MTTFYICRHGQTENNLHQRLSGWLDTPLTDKGVSDAIASATKLRGRSIDRIISSDLGRAFTTAYIITRELETTLEIERAKELREINYGDLANQPLSAHPKLSPEDNATHQHPNGESLVQMQQRVLNYISALASSSPEKSVLLVAHDGTIKAIRANFLQQNIGIIDLTTNAFDFVGKFSVKDGTIVAFEELQTL